MPSPLALCRIFIPILLSLLALGGTASCTATLLSRREKASEAAVQQVKAQLVGNWSMKMETMMDVSELSAAEQEHLSAMMGEMLVIMKFTEDGRLLSSADGSVVSYEVEDSPAQQGPVHRLLLNGTAVNFAVSDNQLILEGNGEILRFKRTEQSIHQVADNPFAAPPSLSAPLSLSNADGQQSAGAINRAQQVHYLENADFASELSELGLGLEATGEIYRFSIRNTETASFTHAIAQSDGLRSAVGAVFVVPEAQSFMGTQAIVCVADAPGATLLPEPILDDNAMACPQGSSKGSSKG